MLFLSTLAFHIWEASYDSAWNGRESDIDQNSLFQDWRLTRM